MKITALMPVRNEDWILGLSLRAALLWADEVVVLDHCSTDGTRDIISAVCKENPCRVMVLREDEPKWDEMRHRQALLELARMPRQPSNAKKGVDSGAATHICIVDADEILTGNLLPKIRDIIAGTPAGDILSLPGYNLRNGIQRFHANGVWGNRWFSFAFRDHPKLHWTGDCFHHREPMGMTLNGYHPIDQGQGGIMHLWGASERRLRAKHAWYKITEALRFPDKPRVEINYYYSQAVDPRTIQRFEKPWTYSPAPSSWWEPYGALMPHLKIDAEPWQERMVRDAIAEHGRERFAGLDLFGL